jgi:hypothetical protein
VAPRLSRALACLRDLLVPADFHCRVWCFLTWIAFRTRTGLVILSLFPAPLEPQVVVLRRPRPVRPCQLAARVARGFPRRCPRMP